ncbi:lipopolysaccharide biosynthesis protein [Photobacterium atrarenae]|uniref:Oligosaccharide flippase family protein n=1 Tax=Photobacterium atrarenae TaxID=865757 RepID=A0ABY5GCQ6_9GAMM|nr:oligosaccharide flippase family protein [Photobacterium atrarenae]UTV26971.1 oligosaccharide flippase family protein [Photobacterium atrarenae]
MFKNKVVSDFINYFFSDLFVKGFLFISLPLLSNIMPPSEYGKLSLVNSAIMILFVFMGLNLQNAISNKFMKDSSHFGEYLFSNLCIIVPIQAVILVTSPFYADFLGNLFGLSSIDIQWVLFISVLLTIFYIYTIYLQASRQSKKYAFYNISSKLLEIILIFVFALCLKDNQYLSKIYSQIIVTGALLLLVSKEIYKLLVFRFDFSYVRNALLFSLPLIPHVLSNSLLTQVDRFIINDVIGLSAAGIYSFAYNLAMAVIVVILAWNSSWQPKLYQLLNDQNYESIIKTTKRTTILISFVAMASILFSKEMVMFLAAKEYYEAAEIVPIIIIGNSLTYVYLTYANFVFYQRKTFSLSVATFFALTINFGLNTLLIPKFGIVAAAWTTVISYIFLCLCYLTVSKISFKESPIGLTLMFQLLTVTTLSYIMTVFIDSHIDMILAIVVKIMIVMSALSLMYFRRNQLLFS